MKLQVEVRKVYGVDMIYPANEAARILAALVGNKTLNNKQLELARALGHTIEEITPAKLALKPE